MTEDLGSSMNAFTDQVGVAEAEKRAAASQKEH